MRLRERVGLAWRAMGLALGRVPAPDVRVYMGAEASRLMADFNDPMLSADQATGEALRPLRDRARQLVRDTALAKAFVQASEDNIVGPDGVQLQVLTSDPAINTSVREAFHAWCDREACTVDGRLSFTEFERAAVRAWRSDGEVLVRLWRGRGPFGLQLQLLDADLLDETHHQTPSAGRPEIRQGVELDELGRPVAYHLWERHPSEWGRASRRVRVPAEDIVHLYLPDRPGQTRGITPFAPVMRDLWQLAGMQHATLVGQRVAAMQSFFLVPQEPDADPMSTADQKPGALPVTLAPGRGVRLPFGWGVQSYTPAIPQNTYEPFHRVSVHHICAGLGVTYVTLFGDAKDANYGSQRGMRQKEQRMWRTLQQTLVDVLHARVFREWLTWSVVAGRVRLRGASPASIRHEWLLPTWEWVDPLKDAQTAALEIATGMNSLTAVAAARGRDLDTILRQRADELKRAQALGVPLLLPSSTTLLGAEANADSGAGAADGAATDGADTTTSATTTAAARATPEHGRRAAVLAAA